MKKPRILAPAGNFVSLRSALDAGADEVYFGVKGLNMRASAQNFTLDDLPEIAKLCQEYNTLPLLTLNVIVYEHEIDLVTEMLSRAYEAGIRDVIAWDMAVISIAVKKGFRIHLSTQASISNSASLEFYHNAIPSLHRVVLARECSLDDIIIIKKNHPSIEIETFIHGAMCVSVSGRCFMSHHLFGMSANRGQCLQPCRRSYNVHDADKVHKDSSDKEYLLHDGEEEHSLVLGSDYVMSPEDLCTLPFIEKLIDAGIDVCKIEGRGRSPEYVDTVVRAYRSVVDFYHEHASILRDEKNSKCEEVKNTFAQLKKEEVVNVRKVYNRGFSSGFYLGKPISAWCDSYGSKSTEKKELVGKVINYYHQKNVALILVQSNEFALDDELLIMGTTSGLIRHKVTQIRDEKGKSIRKALKGTQVTFPLPSKVRSNDDVYVVVTR